MLKSPSSPQGALLGNWILRRSTGKPRSLHGSSSPDTCTSHCCRSRSARISLTGSRTPASSRPTRSSRSTPGRPAHWSVGRTAPTWSTAPRRQVWTGLGWQKDVAPSLCLSGGYDSFVPHSLPPPLPSLPLTCFLVPTRQLASRGAAAVTVLLNPSPL